MEAAQYQLLEPVKAINDIGFYFGILLSLSTSVYGSRGPINNKIPNPAILGKEGLELALPPQRALLIYHGLLLVGFRHVTLYGLTVPGEVSRADKALEAVEEPQSRDSLAGKQFNESLQGHSLQEMRYLPQVSNPDLTSRPEAVVTRYTE
ncbi:hypothetical protein NA56DRAFT_713503 [Hyaloscypha hepaticicola]|uniref:Uncharacterized protein n=1 Tax=Hyaloscypha hepaticicola TaxID=2082293 RepID=A0A2J6PDJ5_9HELO|nr:hypothetical protein NA56DRAFT_713503 [Hyaloscypha hepaticicola]